MKRKSLVYALVLATLTVLPALAQVELPRVSPKASVMQQVGLTTVTVQYNRPSMRGREIFGGLVPWGEVWRTGANEATTIEFSDDVTIDGQKLARGLYSLHTIPGQDQWTLIFNSEAKQWGSYNYDQAKDALRVAVKPRQAPHEHETLTIAFPKVTMSSAEAVIAWAGVMVPFTIGVDTNAKVIASVNSALDWRTPYQAANWAYQNEVATPDAMKWIDRSISAQETWQNLSLKARMLAAAGNRKEALAFGQRAVAAAKKLPTPPDTSAFQKEMASWK